MSDGQKPKGRRGRPPLPEDQGKRHPISLRTTKELSDLLKVAADSSGRSIAQEVELRLERSFSDDRLAEIEAKLDELLGRK